MARQQFDLRPARLLCRDLRRRFVSADWAGAQLQVPDYRVRAWLRLRQELPLGRRKAGEPNQAMTLMT